MTKQRHQPSLYATLVKGAFWFALGFIFVLLFRLIYM